MATTRIHIGPADHGRRMTLEEFHEAEEQPGYLYELARGVVNVVEVPGDTHGQVIDNLHECLSRYRREHPGLILRFGHGSDIRLLIAARDSDRHPDLAVVFRGVPPDPEGRQRPSLAIEVVSPGAEARRRDYVEKRDEYLQLGIREYWIVDPERRQLTVLARQGDEKNPAWTEQVFEGNDRIASVLLPGFDGTVSELWTDTELDENGTA
jgi:Uma2 family endonuclease